MKKLISLLFIAFFLINCNEGSSGSDKSGNTKSLNSRDKIRLKQYQVEGARLYATYCANCHQQDGKGLASLYPPLAESDYLLADLSRAACIIKNGQLGEIVVNGITYNQMMPGNAITNLEVAEILTYITNAWGNETGLTGVKDVDKWLKNCEE
ncbi:MAG: cytochrome c [Bacteroidota bacterium]